MYWKEFKEYEKLTALEGEQYAYFKKKNIYFRWENGFIWEHLRVFN